MTKNSSDMKYPTIRINADFWIKVYGWIDGVKIDKLVGVRGLLELIGIDLANKFLDKAYKSGVNKFVCKLRRGIKITFYSK